MIHDVPAFEDLLRSTKGGEVGYLMINSPGGDANAAEKLLTMRRQRFCKEFNVIVPETRRQKRYYALLAHPEDRWGDKPEISRRS